MSAKLTLRIDPKLVLQAKIYAKKHKTSVSKLVTHYFSVLNQNIAEEPILPLTQSLVGILKSEETSEKDYKAYLEDKYL